ncbi:MAG: ParB/RepB/Spo0J family partition protein [Luminiphilus sp.]|nr:ParB/RepB/Spo0J family partition protein [Luminiphilus sp.]
MSTKRQRGKLGKDLDLLLGTPTSRAPKAAVETLGSEETDEGQTARPNPEGLRYLPLEKLQRGQFQPRRDFDDAALKELSESIQTHGVLQPIVVRALGPDRWEIVAGERRWRASQMAGQERIPALVRAVDDEATIAMALIENIQREDLNAVEEAQALHRLQVEFALSQREIAERVGKSRSVIANLLRLLTLEPVVKAQLETGELDTGHGKVLLALEGAEQIKAAKAVAKKGLSVRQTEALVKSIQRGGLENKSGADATDPDVARLERDLSDRLGSPVVITQGKGKSGKIVIRYSSLEELDGLLGRIR